MGPIIEARDNVAKKSILLFPKTNCSKCYGRGIVGWIEKKPLFCKCVEKDFMKVREMEKLNRGTGYNGLKANPDVRP